LMYSVFPECLIIIPQAFTFVNPFLKISCKNFSTFGRNGFAKRFIRIASTAKSRVSSALGVSSNSIAAAQKQSKITVITSNCYTIAIKTAIHSHRKTSIKISITVSTARPVNLGQLIHTLALVAWESVSVFVQRGAWLSMTQQL